jgi:hypothetical protein
MWILLIILFLDDGHTLIDSTVAIREPSEKV